MQHYWEAGIKIEILQKLIAMLLNKGVFLIAKNQLLYLSSVQSMHISRAKCNF